MRIWWIKETSHGCDNAFRHPSDQNGHWEELRVAIDVAELEHWLRMNVSDVGGVKTTYGDAIPEICESIQDLVDEAKE